MISIYTKQNIKLYLDEVHMYDDGQAKMSITPMRAGCRLYRLDLCVCDVCGKSYLIFLFYI